MMVVRIMSILIAFLLFGCATTYTTPHKVYFTPNTEPEVDVVYEKGQPHSQADNVFIYEVRKEDYEAKKIQLPTLIFQKRGYYPYEYTPGPIKIDNDFYNNQYDRNRYWHGYQNEDTRHLMPDFSYKGPDDVQGTNLPAPG